MLSLGYMMISSAHWRFFQKSLEIIKRFTIVFHEYSQVLYQFTLSIHNMKIVVWLQVFSAISLAYGFLQYPFLANDMLENFFESIEKDQSISLDSMVKGEECNRACKENDIKVCRFHFMMKYFQVLGG